jgi:hypothetical protein
MWLQTDRHRILAGIVVLLLLAFIVSCGVGGLASGSAPRWACPSPTPKPWGEGGSLKEQIALPTAIPAGPQEYQDVYYEEWEQQYPELEPPFPSPTPYTVIGTNYVLGQRVEVGPLHVLVDARPGAVVERPGVPAEPNNSTLWISPGSIAIAIRSRSTTVSACACAQSPVRRIAS